MPSSSELPEAPWKLGVGGVLVALLLASAAYDANLLGFGRALSPPVLPLAVEAGTTFTDVTEASGLAFRRGGWDPDATRYAAILGGGAGVADVDLDGWPDVVLSGGEGERSALFLNQRDGTFRDATDAWGLDARGLCNGVAFGDYDADGKPDLAIACLGKLWVYHHEGTRYREVAGELGLGLEGRCGPEPCLASSLGWLDLDLDRDLDLYVVNNVEHRAGEALPATRVFPYLAFARAQPALLFRNDAGAFAEVGVEAGVDNPGGKGLGLLVTDLDLDGWADLYVANDLSENRAYLNQRDGTFRDAARGLGLNEVKSSMGVDAGDPDGDGDLDLAITNVRGQALSFLRDGGARFAEATEAAGLRASAAGTGWGVVWFDYDLDGDADLAQAVGTFFDPRVSDVRDQLFRNLGEGRFAEVTGSAGAVGDAQVSRALVAFDYDRDGDQDLLVANTLGGSARLLRNDLARGAEGPGSLQLRLVGTQAHPDAIGARVAVELPSGERALRVVSASCSYQASCPLELTFGLGAARSAQVTVHWPGGHEQRLGNVAAGAWRVTQGGGAEPLH